MGRTGVNDSYPHSTAETKNKNKLYPPLCLAEWFYSLTSTNKGDIKT